MVPAGFKASEGAMKYKTELLRRFKIAAEAGNSTEMGTLMERIAAIDAALDGLNDIRPQMQRSLAEKNKEYAKTTLPSSFPKFSRP